LIRRTEEAVKEEDEEEEEEEESSSCCLGSWVLGNLRHAVTVYVSLATHICLTISLQFTIWQARVSQTNKFCNRIKFKTCYK
jgi:hypothetical protein